MNPTAVAATDNGTYLVIDKDAWRLDLGCGQNRQPGFTGVDIVIPNAWPADDPGYVQADLFSTPWPFKDDSVGQVYCSHFVEHVPDLVKFWNELWRVCNHGAHVTMIHPYWTSVRCWQDPTHLRAMSEASYLYVQRQWRESQRLDHYPIVADFKIASMDLMLNEPWDRAEDRDREFAIRHYVNVVSDMVVQMQAVKR